MNSRNLRYSIYTLGVTNLSNPLEFMRLGVPDRMESCHNRSYCPYWPVDYEKWFCKLLQDKEKFGIRSSEC